jgi:DNA-binding beta-propeller fold protein YncE
MRAIATAAAVLLATTLAVSGAETAPRFASKPTAKKAGGEVEISFSVTGPTDVSVAIVNAEGEVVRHLAAGVLGSPSAPSTSSGQAGSGQGKPPEPLKAGLSQTLEWDGKDDRGRPASGGPFKARVSLGLRPALDGFIGFDPASYNPLRTIAPYAVRALATGQKGEVFVFYNFGARESWAVATSCAVLDRKGKYLRTIVPYPAGLAENELKGLRRIEVENGLRIPFIYQKDKNPGVGRGRSLLPVAAEANERNNMTRTHRAVAAGDGRLAFIGTPVFKPLGKQGTRAVFVINADGSVPPDGVIKTAFDKGVLSATLALSPDGKTLYAAGLHKTREPVNTVYRFGWKDSAPQPFVSSGLKGPEGVATDSRGNVYVADRGNDRIAIFKPDGAPLGELKIESPAQVEIHPGTGALYVLAGEHSDKLLKFSSWKQARPVAKTTVPSLRRYASVLALDGSADPAVLWVGTTMGYARYVLLRIEDKGDAFGPQVDVARMPAESPVFSANDVMTLSFSRKAGVLNVGSKFYDANKGEFLTVDRSSRALVSCGSFGLDGNFYTQLAHTCVRLGPDLKLRPFPKGGANAGEIARLNKNPLIEKTYGHLDKHGGLQGIGGSGRLRGRGVTADPEGNVYVLLEKAWKSANATALSVYNPDGSMRKRLLIDTEFRCMESVRVDLQGNIYVAFSIRPGEQLLPPGLVGKVPADMNSADARMGFNYYPDLYGSIIKFGPEGGLVKKGSGGVKCNFGHGGVTEVKGAKWIHLGVTGTLGFNSGKHPTHHCSCQSSRIDVDGFGRVFFPDAGRFRIWVLDTDGNEICWFGSYGNVDSAGPESSIPKPDIPLAWPQAVAADAEGNVYVGDRINRRVVKVKLNYAAEETCALP